MTHIRKQIRDAIVELIKDETEAAANVFPQRVRPFGAGTSIVCLIYALTEPATAITMDPVLLDRIVNVSIEAHIKSNAATLDDRMDAFAVAVETKMAEDRTFGGLAKESGLTNTRIEHDGDGEKIIGIIRLEYSVMYQTYDTDPETSI